MNWQDEKYLKNMERADRARRDGLRQAKRDAEAQKRARLAAELENAPQTLIDGPAILSADEVASIKAAKGQAKMGSFTRQMNRRA